MKAIYLKKLFQRGRQRARLLIARPDFQTEIILLRKKWSIPKNGFKNKELNQKWHHEFYQSDDDFYEKVWLKRRGEIIKLEEEGKFSEAEDLKKELNNISPINAFRIAIKNLLKKYKLPLRWEESIRRYILFNNIDNMRLPGGITIHEEYDKDTELKKLSIEIEDDTTLEDIKQSWSSIKYHQKRLHSHKKDKFQPIKKFERDKEAYNLKQSGNSYNEIANTLSKKYNKVISYDDVASYIKRHKQRTGIN